MPTADHAAGTAFRVVTEVLVAALVLAVVAGVLWSVVAPDVQGEVTSSGVVVRRAEARRQFGVDGWFGVLSAICGLALGAVALRRHQHRPVTVLLALVGAGVAGSVVAWRLGVLLGPGPVEDRAAGLATGARLPVPLEVNSPAMLLVWPIAALVSAVVVAALLDDRRPWRGAGGRQPLRWPIRAVLASVRRIRSAGASSTSRPRRPADT